ncbi:MULTISPECIES: carbohydrate ABC transporter permease [Micromonospora]|uniref:ABC transporter permease n=1 Tax=Micromonospora maris TaxID=1003110 RepID=A0A9X0I8S6_9ACTN|nr:MULTISPECIES: sugar ABC transporter permease [Micromonospora]AEB43700.1 binding-protein-dependent transport systems inner membrane component [Micromonospora maris AB-18-032]KUJ48987.1 ABC transporter permease [Micromonospora maris]RUL91839.1 sugar ABC transporter permease [Verrucosispora sp. FIM060022]
MSLSATTAPPSSAPPPPNAEPRRRRGHLLNRLDLKYSPYLYIAPFFLIFGVFGFYPMLRTAWMSLHDWDMIGENSFIGFDNYTRLISDEYFWNALVNTFGIFALSTIPQLLLALFLANLLNRTLLRAKTFFRMAIFIPNVVSVAAVAIVFGMLYQRDFGLFNWLLSFAGVEAIDWNGEKWSSWTALATMVNWRWTGYNTLILLAGMQAIPKDLYEAAAIDGAGQWRQFWQITLPMLKPTFIFVVILSTIGGMQLFTEPLLFANGNIIGGDQRQFQTLAMYMYEMGIVNLNTAGYGAAVAWAIFMIIVLVSLINFVLVRRTAK